jgi:hypothetical protein
MVLGMGAVTNALWHELLLYIDGDVRWPVRDWNRGRRSTSCMNAPSLCSVAGSGEVKIVGSGFVEDFMGQT